jgi:hypothetical protein
MLGTLCYISRYIVTLITLITIRHFAFEKINDESDDESLSR